MSEQSAIGNRRLAIGRRPGKGRRIRVADEAARFASISPVAYRLLPIAISPRATSHIANPCTVTRHGTSVTNLPLAESVLISVGRFALDGETEKRIWPSFTLTARVPRCSFQGGTCIQ
jgi:hypothetical protein